MKKNKIITIGIIIFLLIMVYFVIQIFDPFHTLPIVELKDNLTAEQNEKVTNISYIEDVRHGKVNSKEENIDYAKFAKQYEDIEAALGDSIKQSKASLASEKAKKDGK